MSTKTRRTKRKVVKEKIREAVRPLKNKLNGLQVFEAQNDCGCCYETMLFKSAESAGEAFSKAGLMNGAVVVDDAGVKHDRIDTFYGFWLADSETARTAREEPLKLLAEKVLGKYTAGNNES